MAPSTQGARGTTVEAALGLRAFAGSLEALLRAAFDLVDTNPQLTVTQRSLLWDCMPPGVGRCAALGLTTELGIEQLHDVTRALQERVNRSMPAESAPMRVELLWAYDPSGVATPPRAIAPPPVPRSATPEELVELAKLPSLRPDMPPGRMELHPDVRTRASACGPLVEVAPEARDPETTRFVSEILYDVPEPYIERPLPFTPQFETTRHRTAAGVTHVVTAPARADLLAAAAEAYAWAQRCAEPLGPTSILPIEAVDIVVAMPPKTSPEQRMLRWLEAVRAVIGRERLWPRRAVVLQDANDWVRGVLFGQVYDRAPDLGQPHGVTLSVTPMGLHRAEIHVVPTPAAP